MSNRKTKELELLAKICKENDVSFKMANSLIKSAVKYSYENVTQGTRTNDYQQLIEFYSKNND